MVPIIEIAIAESNRYLIQKVAFSVLINIFFVNFNNSDLGFLCNSDYDRGLPHLPQNRAPGVSELPHLPQNKTVVCLLDGDSCWTVVDGLEPFFMMKIAPMPPPTATAAITI